jgi:hypothetical protein
MGTNKNLRDKTLLTTTADYAKFVDFTRNLTQTIINTLIKKKNISVAPALNFPNGNIFDAPQ